MKNNKDNIEYSKLEIEKYHDIIDNITTEKINIFYKLCKEVRVELEYFDDRNKLLLDFFNKCKLLRINDLKGCEIEDFNYLYKNKENYNKIHRSYFDRTIDFAIYLNNGHHYMIDENYKDRNNKKLVSFNFIYNFFDYLFINEELSVNEIEIYLRNNLKLIEY